MTPPHIDTIPAGPSARYETLAGAQAWVAAAVDRMFQHGGDIGYVAASLTRGEDGLWSAMLHGFSTKLGSVRDLGDVASARPQSSPPAVTVADADVEPAVFRSGPPVVPGPDRYAPSSYTPVAVEPDPVRFEPRTTPGVGRARVVGPVAAALHTPPALRTPAGTDCTSTHATERGTTVRCARKHRPDAVGPKHTAGGYVWKDPNTTTN